MSFITTIHATGTISADRSTINDNTTYRHSVDPVAKSATYTATAADQCIVVDASGGAVTINLPAVASSSGMSLYVIAKSVTGGNVTIDGAASETINGATTLVLSVAFTGKRLFCDGAQWYAL